MSSTLLSLLRMEAEVRSLRELSERSGIDLGSLQRAQGGDIAGWTVSMVTRLARALGVDPALALEDAPLPVPNLLAFLREPSWGIDPRDSIALRRALSRASSLRSAGLKPVHTYQTTPAPERKAFEAGYKAANRVRRDIANTAAPLEDLRGVIEARLGVVLVAMRLESPRLEALAIASDAGAAIVLNTRLSLPKVVLRRSIAHELCHILFDPRDGAPLLDVIAEGGEDEPEPAAPQRARREQRARAFAAELLVPLKALRSLSGGRASTVDQARALTMEVSRTFGAPWELVAHHLCNHELIDAGCRDRLLLERPDISFPAGIGSSEALRWARARVDEGELSEGRARDIFGSDWPDGEALSA